MTTDPSSEFELPIVPVTHTVLFPGAVVPVIVFEEGLKSLVDEVCREGDLKFGVVFAPARDEFDPKPPLNAVGTLGQIIQHKRSPTGEINLMVQGYARFRIQEYVAEKPYLVARVVLLEDVEPQHAHAVKARVIATFREYLSHCEGDVAGLQANLERASTLGLTVDIALACIPTDPERRQGLLETLDSEERAEGLLSLVSVQLKEISLNRRLRKDPDLGISLN
ncbi:MAG: LON peptidase substrate-binding domain-containing protein [Planctomycetota bacterium]